MHRRDFLHPRNVAGAAGRVVGALDELRDLADARATPSSEVLLLTLSRRSMATDFEILMPYGMPEARDASEDAFDAVDAVEDQLTVYRENSVASYLNRHAAAVPVRVEPDVLTLLALCKRLHHSTDGAFDVTAGALIKAWGFYRGPPRIPSAKERVDAMDTVGSQQLCLDAERKTVRFERAGLELNFGSIGKGYALDRAARLLRDKWEMPSCLLQGGHSSVVAIGCQPGEPRGWPVGIADPLQPERRLGVIRIKDRALSTSAPTHKHLEHNGRKLGHVLDPRSGWPAEGMASVSVVAPTAAEADALATALFILGMDRSRAYCDAHPEIGALLIPAGDHVRPVVLNLDPSEIDWTVR